MKKILFGLFLAVLFTMFTTPVMAKTNLSPTPGNYSGAACVRASSDNDAVKSFNYFKDGGAVSVTTCLMLSGGAYTIKAVGFDEKGAAVADEETEGSYTAGIKVTGDTFADTGDAFGHRSCKVTVTKTKKGAKKTAKAAAPVQSPFKFKAADATHSYGLLPGKSCQVDGTDADGNPKLKCEDSPVDVVDGVAVAQAVAVSADRAATAMTDKLKEQSAKLEAIESELAAARPKAKPGVQAAYTASYSDLGLAHGGAAAVKYCFGRLCPLAGGGLGSTGEGVVYTVFGGALVPFGPDVDGVFLAEARFYRAEDVDADTIGARAGLQLGVYGPAYVEPSLFMGDEDGEFSVSGQAAVGVRF